MDSSESHQHSSPNRYTMPNSTSKNKITMEDLDKLVKKHEANIEGLSLGLNEMEQRAKNIEDALMEVDAIGHSAKALSDQIWQQVDENIDKARKHQRSADALKRQKNMYHALGINPVRSGL